MDRWNIGPVILEEMPPVPRICWILSVARAVAPDGRGGGDPVPEAQSAAIFFITGSDGK